MPENEAGKNVLYFHLSNVHVGHINDRAIKLLIKYKIAREKNIY